MSSTKKLKEEFETREKPLKTAVELGAELPEIISLQERSITVKSQIDMYLAKVISTAYKFSISLDLSFFLYVNKSLIIIIRPISLGWSIVRTFG